MTSIKQDNQYLQFKTAQSQAPFAYMTSMQYQAACPASLPLTSSCRYFNIGADRVPVENNLRSVPTKNNVLDQGRPQTSGNWALVGHDVYKSEGEGRFAPDQIALETSLRAPLLTNDRHRSRLQTGAVFQRSSLPKDADVYPCPPVSNMLAFPRPTRFDQVTVVNPHRV